jgi:hypothetical protein
MKTYIKLFVALFFLGSIHFSCKREFEKPRWNTQILAPLVKSKLTIRDIIKEGNTIETEADNSISLINRQQIFDYTIDSLVTLNAGQYKNTVKLNSLALDSQTITKAITLGQIALQLKASSNPSDQAIGNQIIIAGQLGIPLPVPAITGIKAGPINIDISKFFQTADLLRGQMVVSVKNGLPLEISDLQFTLKNVTPSSTITSQTFTNITPGASQSKIQDLSGKTIGGSIQASIDQMDIAGGFVSIDTSAAILVTIAIRNIQVFSATAIFPAQNVVDDTANVKLLGLKNVALTKAIIRQGTVRADVYSTAGDTVRFTYEIPKATKDGHSFVFEAVVPPAPPGGTSYAIFNTDFSGYTLDLTGERGDTVNTFYNVLVGKIKYTGRLVSLSLADSLDITLTLVDPKPSYVKGYLGQDTINVGPGVIDLDIFKNISATTLDFKSMSLAVAFENALGVPARATLTSLKAMNTIKGTSLSLSGTPIVSAIAPATDGGHTAIPAVSTIDLSTGSNAKNLLNILPNKLSYSGTFDLNPLGNTNTYTDFAYSGVDLKAYLDLKIPLSVIAENLVLKDTSSMDIPELKTQGFQNGKFNLLVTNGFPLDVKVDMRFLDKNGFQVDSIITSKTILAAPVNSLGRVTEAKVTAVPFLLTAADVYTLVNNATKVVFTARFDTKPSNTYINIYSDNFIEFKLVGDMNILVNSGK